MPSGQTAGRRSDARKADAAATRRGRSTAALAGVIARFDDDVGRRSFKLAQIVHFEVPTGRCSTGRTFAASDVVRCRSYKTRYITPAYVISRSLPNSILPRLQEKILPKSVFIDSPPLDLEVGDNISH